jgi:hypothetical protein
VSGNVTVKSDEPPIIGMTELLRGMRAIQVLRVAGSCGLGFW